MKLFPESSDMSDLIIQKCLKVIKADIIEYTLLVLLPLT